MFLPNAVSLDAQTLDCPAVWESLGGPYQDLRLSLELTKPTSHPAVVARAGRELLRDCGVADTTHANGLQFTLLPAAMLVENNSKYPRSQQDGLRWAGRGLSAAAIAGVGVRWKSFSAVLAPEVAYQQNNEFPTQPTVTGPYSPFASYYHRGLIDMPQRFGDESFWVVSPGQSFARLDAYGVGLGVSTENMRWGPARRNPLLMSFAAAGFPHVFVSTTKPVNVGIGTIDADASWGLLDESDYFDLRADNDTRIFAGLVVSFTPVNSGVTIGAARSYLGYKPDTVAFSRVFTQPYHLVGKNMLENQLLSLFIRWVLPQAGFEFYGEYGREDHWEDLYDLNLEIDHSRAYTVGLEKLITLRDSATLRLSFETSNLESSKTFEAGRGKVTFYTHAEIIQGYTHKGQLLGAPIGPGGSMQYGSVDYLGNDFLAGVYIERARYENDVYYTVFAPLYTSRGHDAEITLGLRGSRRIGGVNFIGGLARSTRHNRAFYDLQQGAGLTTEKNLSFTLAASWVPRRNVF